MAPKRVKKRPASAGARLPPPGHGFVVHAEPLPGGGAFQMTNVNSENCFEHIKGNDLGSNWETVDFFTSRDPWFSNTAIGELLFRDEGKFKKYFIFMMM